tara:strand:- start:1519 stop:2406 length:888 start_codon:yes stop_codon:yes gene_type:complete
MKKNICIIGGSGFLGSHVCDELSKNKDYRVTVFDINKSKFLNKKQKMIIGNIMNFKLVKKTLKNQDFVFNFSGISQLDLALNKPSMTAEFNILGLLNILEACRLNKVKQFIQASSIYSLSNDGGFYSCSKRAAEDYIREYKKKYNLNYTILRYGSLYGPRADKTNGIFKIINYAIKNNKLLYEGSRLTRRNYISVEDASFLSVKILNKKFHNKTLILKGRDSIKVLDLLKKLSKILIIDKKKIYFNEKKQQLGHYVTNPDPYKIDVGKELKYKKKINFTKSIEKLVLNIKNKNEK